MRKHFATLLVLSAALVSQHFAAHSGFAESLEPVGPGGSTVNRVLSLDGKTGYVEVADSESLHSFKEAITIEAWVKAASFYTGNGEVNSIVRKNITPGAENFLLRFRIVDGERLAEMNPGVRVGIVQAPYEFTTGTWYHLAGTYDGKAITVYVNGVKVRGEPFSGPMNIDKSDLFIGKGDPDFSSGEYFHGELDDIRIWNVSRSQKEIQAAMNTPLTGKEEGLVAYWNFDDGTSKDLSPYGNDGRLCEGARIEEAPRPTAVVSREETRETTFPQLSFHTWGSTPFSAILTANPRNQRILFCIRKDPKGTQEIAEEVKVSSEKVSSILSRLAEHDLVRDAADSKWVANFPIYTEEEIVKANQIGLKYARLEADIFRSRIPDLKRTYEQCQVSKYHPWSKASLIVVGALCADFCVSDRIRFKPEFFDERFLPPLHRDGRRWGYSGEQVLSSPFPFRKYQFYQNVFENPEGGLSCFGYYYLLDEERKSPPSRPESLRYDPEGKIWLSLTTPSTVEEIQRKTGLDPGVIQSAIDAMSTWNPPGVIKENDKYTSSIAILSSNDLKLLLPETDRIAEIIFKEITIPMEKELEEEGKRLGLRFPLPSGTSARDIALQILSEEGLLAVPQPPVPWNSGVWGWNGHLKMWEDMRER
jgi:predicted transcriptional regulator